jgi:hypothetical protein
MGLCIIDGLLCTVLFEHGTKFWQPCICIFSFHFVGGSWGTRVGTRHVKLCVEINREYIYIYIYIYTYTQRDVMMMMMPYVYCTFVSGRKLGKIRGPLKLPSHIQQKRQSPCTLGHLQERGQLVLMRYSGQTNLWFHVGNTLKLSFRIP